MPILKFDERAIVRDLNPADSPVIFWDGGQGSRYPGLGVIVSPRGVKTWVVQAKLPDGRSVRKKLDRLERLTLPNAWARGREEIGKILLGTHPREEQRRERERRVEAKRAAKTVRDAIEEYVAAAGLKASSAAQYRAHVEGRGHLVPWANRQLREITPEDVSRRYDAIIAEVKKRVHRGGKAISGVTMANMTMGVFGAAWRWAANSDRTLGQCPTWILAKRMKKAEPRRSVIDEDALPAFYAATLRLPELQRDLVIYTLFTGARLQEAQGLLWSEVSFDKGLITIGADRMKAGKAHVIPMSDVVRGILVRRRAMGDGGFVFLGRGGHTNALPLALRAIANETGARMAPHDLRRTFVTVAEATEGLSVYQLKRLIAHAAGGRTDVTSGYVMMQEKRMVEAAQLVADKLKALCGMEALPSGVVKLR